MLQMIEANWIVFALALLIGLLVAWWIFARGSSDAGKREHRPDVLDEGAAPAQRNQALIDAPSAADLSPPAAAGTMAGVGEIVAVAAQDEVELAAAEPSAPPSAPASDDDLTRIKGLGPKLRDLLATLGVTRFEQIAAWTSDDIAEIDSKLGRFEGRIERDNWVAQAKYLAADDMAGFEGQFGKL